MTAPHDTPTPTANRLLAALPPANYAAIAPHLEPLALPLKYILYEPNKPIEYVYFPLGGVCSIVTLMEDGAAVEVGTVGKEGMIGIPVFLGAMSTPTQAFIQVPGDGVRIPANTFRRLLAENEPLRVMLQRYTQALFVQIAQSTACNRVHAVEARCAHWLLMTADRVGNSEFPLTQEFLGQMLGVRRATVNEVQRTLQQAGLIRYSRGHITILDRAGLEAMSCECYGVIRTEYDRLLE